MPRTITAVYANTTPRRYVTAITKRKDGSIVVELSDDMQQAHNFGSKEDANELIPHFVNPFNRIYKPEKISVKNYRPVLQNQDELA